MYMKLKSKFLNSVRIKIQLLKRLQHVIVVDGATHSQKDGVESNGGSLKGGAEAFMLFLCGAQLVLRSSVFTVLDLDELDVAPSFVEVFRSMLSGVGGSAGGWQSAGVFPVSLSCPLPLRRTHPPAVVSCFCVFAAMGVTSTISGRLEVNLSLSGKRGGKSHL
jgi:hypothetical protein